MVFLMETKLDQVRMEGVRRKYGFTNGIDVEAEGSRGGLSLVWKGDIDVTIRSYSKWHIDAIVGGETGQDDWRFAGFYGSPYLKDKNIAWDVLRRLSSENTHPWLVAGDFNEILFSFEKKGGGLRDQGRMDAFRDILEDCQLMDIGYSGTWFTWERGNIPETNIRKRLDRGVANDKWITLFLMGRVQHLSFSMSDHCPLLISTDNSTSHSAQRKFHFESWWTLEVSTEKVIKEVWEGNSESFLQKLQTLQHRLKVWALSVKNKREDQKRRLAKELEILLNEERDDEILVRIIDTKIHLNMEIDKDEMYWEQRARANWLRLGDKNSAFFHKCATTRRRTNSIPKLISEDGSEITTETEINESATNCFRELFTSKGVANADRVMDGVEVSITDEMKTDLLSPFRVEEVWVDLKEMGPTKAPGPDGFPALFFQRVQSAFVPGRLISDNELLAYEILHTFKKKPMGQKGYMAVKLDMSKAYDRVEWDFVKKMMLRMRFAQKWVDLIMKCITTVSYSVITNEEKGSSFHSSRSLRQCDPLSPFLFFICSEGARILKKILKEYESCYGQCVNFSKSTIFYSSNTRNEKREDASRILGRTRMLSKGGKEVFIKSVLQAIPTYAMSYFLLPRVLCQMIENKIVKYWWQKGGGKRGIHWCQWRYLCRPKEEGDLGFRNMAQFNIALLAKQGWRLLIYPDSLVAQVFKAKYFPTGDFPSSSLSHSGSYVWRSIWATKAIVEKGLFWRVGTGIQISIQNDAWIPNCSKKRLNGSFASRWRWNRMRTFEYGVVNRLGVVRNTSCPRCGDREEDINHIFRVCPVSKSVWEDLSDPSYAMFSNEEFLDWLTRLLVFLPSEKRRIFCGTLWVIWGDRNSRIHKQQSRSSQEMVSFVYGYLKELDGLKIVNQKSMHSEEKWQHPPGQILKINFNGAFDERRRQLASRVVVSDKNGRVLVIKSELHDGVEFAFAAEALACHRATQITLVKNNENIIIEGDSLSIIKKCKNSDLDRSEVGVYIQDIHKLQAQCMRVSFKHVRRMANNLAHIIAKESLKRREEVYLIEAVPGYAEVQVRSESMRKPD
ncbi:reverse transcriptase [Gossypium australe]|uniref:Reverse transcriptase n=1 Tax=Gossypium australe TaxID=47621 RepID=A0A5B6UAF9_9ROSI|nr:reverse transcriptase [Gossypium australe]